MANHPHLTTQKILYVEISRTRGRAELVTDGAKALREQLEAVTGERISALEGIGESDRAVCHEAGRRGSEAQAVSRMCRCRVTGDRRRSQRCQCAERQRALTAISDYSGPISERWPQSGHWAEFLGLASPVEFGDGGMSTVVAVKAVTGYSRIRTL